MKQNYVKFCKHYSKEMLMIRMCQLKMFFKIFHSGIAGSSETTFLSLNCRKVVYMSVFIYFLQTATHIL